MKTNYFSVLITVKRIENTKDKITPIFKDEWSDKICLLDKSNNEQTTVPIGEKTIAWVMGRGKKINFIKTNFDNETIVDFINQIPALTLKDYESLLNSEKGKLLKVIDKFDAGYNLYPYGVTPQLPNLLEIFEKIPEENLKIDKDYLLVLDHLYDKYRNN